MPEPIMIARLFIFVLFLTTIVARAQAAGVPVAFQLPADGPLPRTYLVTLAIVDAKNPDWIVSQFVCGAARTVTAENGGKFTETWDGLDDNSMPVPPGDYAVKGIYMPARQWAVDGEWHTITPKFAGGASSWLPTVDEAAKKGLPFGGDPVGAPFEDVAVGPNGVAAFYYQYLENGQNLPMFDLHKPIGMEQFIRAFNSGGAGGGPCVATDGESVWAFSIDGGPKYVYRADGKPFGKSEGANRVNSYLPPGWVTAMAAWRDATSGKSFVAVAQRGKIEDRGQRDYRESETEFVDKITIHEGEGGKVIAELPIARPRGLVVRDGLLYVLHAEGAGWAVSAAKLPDGAWQRVFVVPVNIQPADLELDSHGRFYLSDSAANKVFQLDRLAKVLHAFGRLAAQKPGTYDPETLMGPGKLATWTDAEGKDRLIIVERAGPNRVSEWSADTGKLGREFMTYQTKSNDGYAFDPEHPEHVYVPGQAGWTRFEQPEHVIDPSRVGWITRFRVDAEKGTWAVDAVWPIDENEPRTSALDRPQLIRANGRLYLVGRRSFNVFRLDETRGRWVLSAAVLKERKGEKTTFLWHDANGNGRVEAEETTPTETPAGLLSYHGQNWTEDLALVGAAQSSRDVWRLAPSGFDTHGNPIFKSWLKLFSDPVFEARAAGNADAVHGGNELSDKFVSDWMGVDGSLADGFYVQARGGKNFSANEAPQHKITRYVPDGAGGFRLKWRTGRSVLGGLAKTGEIYGAMRIQRPINGLLSVVDQSRCGILLFTDEGLYVDTIFPDERRFAKTSGIYAQGGEFFAGQVVPNRSSGKILFAMGKYTPLLFEAEGWSLKENPVKPLTTVQRTVSITAAQIASPPEMALSVRGGAGKAKLARFSPALGEVAFDGSMNGWESAEPVVFQADKDQTVEVRCLYRPEEILLRWHARLAAAFEPKPLPALPRIFTHDQLAETLSFYFQGDPNAKAGPVGGRAGDARFVFGIFKDKAGVAQPVAVGMYPRWSGKAKASPQTYRTPVNTTTFAHVGAVEGARLSHKLDADGKGFVLVARIPRAAVPHLAQPFGSGLRTLVNFEATFAGHNKFWWANSDGSAGRDTYDEPSEARLYPGSWAPADFAGLEGGVIVRHWLLCGPFGGPGAEKFSWNPDGKMPGSEKGQKEAVRELLEPAAFPPDSGKVDVKATFTGEHLKGWWPENKSISWKPATIADLDTRVIVGPAAQVWYGATWIHVAAASEVDFAFQGHHQTYLRWFLNGEAVPLKPTDYKEGKGHALTTATRALTLRPGWNQVMFRSYCTGYSPFRAGLVLNAPAEKLWSLQLSAQPPALADDAKPALGR